MQSHCKLCGSEAHTTGACQYTEQRSQKNIVQILEHLTHSTKETHPTITLSEQSQAHVQKVADRLKQQERNVFFVIRCWNKTQADLQQLFERLQKIQSTMPELLGVFISINAAQDTNGQTTNALESILSRSTLPFSVIPLQISKYSWTAGLNAAPALLHSVCQEKDVNEAKQFIFNYSFDAVLSEPAVEQIATHVRQDMPLITMRVEEPVDAASQIEMVQDENRENITRMLDKYYEQLTDSAKTFSVEQFLEDYHQAMVMLGRNTSMLFSLQDIVRLGGFDPACNPLGGMEDHEFVFRLFLEKIIQIKQSNDPNKQKQLVDQLFALNNALKEPVPYNDLAWNHLPQGDKKSGRVFKYDHEKKALTKIGSRLAQQFHKNSPSFGVPVEERDFQFSP